MEKTITLPLDVAKAMYNEGGTGRKFALDHYSEEELTKKELPKRWEDLSKVSGFLIGDNGLIYDAWDRVPNITSRNRNVFATKKQAKSALAMAMLSQLMKQANGDWEPDWEDSRERKYIIARNGNKLLKGWASHAYEFLAFKDEDVRDEFFENHRELIDTYHMI